jgi:SAM-dependent methyltransferase
MSPTGRPEGEYRSAQREGTPVSGPTRAPRRAGSPGASGDEGADTGLPRALSVTHQHLLSLVVTELGRPGSNAPLRILDAGCGDGLLLDYLAQCLQRIFAGTSFEFYGFDVFDHGVQPPDYFRQTVSMLSGKHPDKPWRERLTLISARDPWPWPADFFDIVVSNQVLEHVHDPGHFLSELHRTLRSDGFSAHLFPLRHVLVEPHLHLPLVHWIGDRNAAHRYVLLLTGLGLGARHRGAESVPSFAARQTAYLAENVNYLTSTQILELAAANDLRASFRYTADLYSAKLRSVLRQAPVLRYRSGTTWAAGMTFALLKHVAMVTLVLSPGEPGGGPRTKNEQVPT